TEHGALVGDNTDVAGILAALRQLGADGAGSWRLLGRGGSARAVAVAAAAAKADLHVLSRDAARARDFAAWARGQGTRAEPARGKLQPDIAINATPAGLKDSDPLPLDPDSAAQLHAALDLVYAPGGTRWVRTLTAAGVRAQDGREVLVHQGAAAFSRARSAVWLDGGARDAVHALKYGGLPRIATDLAAAMVGLDVPGLDSGLLIPVPLGRARLRTRGYNQSERLARALGCRWGRPVVDLLVRTRDTAAQTALTPEARLANVAGAFAMRNAERGMRDEGRPDHSAFRIPHSALERARAFVDH